MNQTLARGTWGSLLPQGQTQKSWRALGVSKRMYLVEKKSGGGLLQKTVFNLNITDQEKQQKI